MHRLLAALPLLTLLPSLAFTDGGTAIRIETITWPEVEVRAGPTMEFPATGVLRKGAKVTIRGHVENGKFLIIQPPPGTISWVPKAVVTLMGNPVNGLQAFTIAGDARDGKVPIHPGGKSMADGPLMIATKYEVWRGTQGYIRGNPVTSSVDDKKWYPIDPLPGESRFIPASAIGNAPPDAIAGRSNNSNKGQLTSIPARDVTALLRQAKKADDDGDIAEAIKLYQEVAREVSATDDGLANRCATRVFELRARSRNIAPGALASRNTANNSPGASEPPLPGTSTFEPFKGTSQPQPRQDLRSTGVGFLRRTSFQIDNRPTYALIDRNRQVVWYLTPEPGVNLESYVDRWVDLQGVIELRGDIRGAEYMRVVRAMLVR